MLSAATQASMHLGATHSQAGEALKRPEGGQEAAAPMRACASVALGSAEKRGLRKGSKSAFNVIRRRVGQHQMRSAEWAEADGLTLLTAESSTGYFGVILDRRGKTKPYLARVWRGGNQVSLGSFATAEEAALCIARSPEGRAAAMRAAPQLSEEEGKGTVPPMPPGAFVKEEDVPAAAAVKEEGAVPPMPPDAFVVKTEAVVKEEGSSGSRPKRQRRKLGGSDAQ